MSSAAVPGKPAASGLFLGACGWLEPLKPRAGALLPAGLPADLAEKVNQRDTVPLMRDTANAGLVHAPSINHATTAAVLRNGYLANDGRLAVNVTSRRVRLAMEILEGMRNGQSLGALLGYQLERHIHDNGPIGVRDLVYQLRRAFPLAANRISTTSDEPGTAQESIAAMNVVDGRKLIEHAEGSTPPNLVYPFGVPMLPHRASDQEKAITDALAHIRDVNDAVADLVLAEGVHQAVVGNYERSAGVLDAFAKGNHPPEPDVIRTPRTGTALTLRAAIHLSSNPPADPLPGIAVTPLGRAEPAVNAWLAGLLPLPADVGCPVVFTDRVTDTEQTVFVHQERLGLHAIDLLYRVQAGVEQALGDIDGEILHWLETNRAPRHDRPITIQHTARVGGKLSWFGLQAFLRSARALLASRPIEPQDLQRAKEASEEQQGSKSLPLARIQVPRDHLDTTLIPALDSVTATLNNAAVSIDDALTAFATTVARLAAYRLPQTGTGFGYEWRAGAYGAVVEKLRARIDTWNRRLERYDTRLKEYDALPAGTPDPERFAHLASAELLVSTALTQPQPATPALYRTNVLPARRAAFVAKRGQLQQIVDVGRVTLTALLNDAKNAMPLAAFDVKDIDFAADDAEVARFRRQLVAAVAALKADVVKRVKRVDDLIDEHDAAVGDEKVRVLQEAAKVLFGDDFQLVPLVTLGPASLDDVESAWEHSTSGALTNHLAASRDFPVDDWLHGVARVREKIRHVENLVLLADAIAGKSLDLTPLQLPYSKDEPWLALELPDDHEIDSDRLLYTAHFAEVFDRAKPLCGLLVDEWTEVIPGSRETTGIAFHYDRPNSEAPQSWLLALPTSHGGSWQWDELLAGVNEALDSAKLRAIEPTHVDRTAYGWFLPATMSAYAVPEITISNNLLRNRGIYDDAIRSR
jgi:hypothetical protein